MKSPKLNKQELKQQFLTRIADAKLNTQSKKPPRISIDPVNLKPFKLDSAKA